MRTHLKSRDIILEPADNQRLASLCGQFDEHLRQVERSLGVEINNRGNTFRIIGTAKPVKTASKTLKSLYEQTEKNSLTPEQVHLFLLEAGNEEMNTSKSNENTQVFTRQCEVKPRSDTQRQYVKDIQGCDINFAIGPAGTGKTYLAVACAVQALENDSVRRIILVRPAVEAGERLGFLPGDVAQKIDPYLRPLYDALYEMLGFEYVARLIEKGVIEVAPLAYMRGRTLNDSFIILDEAQNTTIEQMKMFLTRIGFGSTVVVTGDITQVDLSHGTSSGLRHIIDVLKDIDGISFNFFQSSDVVRHSLVQKIVNAYTDFDAHNKDRRNHK